MPKLLRACRMQVLMSAFGVLQRATQPSALGQPLSLHDSPAACKLPAKKTPRATASSIEKGYVAL